MEKLKKNRNASENMNSNNNNFTSKIQHTNNISKQTLTPHNKHKHDYISAQKYLSLSQDETSETQ